MVRVLAQFDDHRSASAAVQALVAASFDPADIQLRALRPDGSSPRLPVQVQNHIVHGFFLGGLIAVPFGVGVGLTTTEGTVASFVAVAAGLGAAAGAAMGIGSWGVTTSRRAVPADAEGFVTVVTVPEGRAASAREVLRRLGGQDATTRLIDPS